MTKRRHVRSWDENVLSVCTKHESRFYHETEDCDCKIWSTQHKISGIVQSTRKEDKGHENLLHHKPITLLAQQKSTGDLDKINITGDSLVNDADDREEQCGLETYMKSLHGLTAV